jgi:hypothetical protein
MHRAHSDSLPRLRSVIEAMDSLCDGFNAASETVNRTKLLKPNNKNMFLESITGSIGLKSTPSEKNAAAQQYLRA